jgi:hypothetical protein
MKHQLFAPVLTGLALALGTTALVSQPSYAIGTTFYCGTRNGAPATIARTSRGDIPMIRWVSNDFTRLKYTPRQRCQEVSARFQNFNDNGTLKFIRTGTVNKYPVLCLASSSGGACAPKAVIVTLQTGSNPQVVLDRLLDLRARAAGKALDLGGSQLIFYQDGDAYLNIEQLLYIAPVERRQN